MDGDVINGWLDSWLPEDAALIAARARAAEVGVPCVDPTTGSLLRLLAATGGAKAVVELGTGAGVSALWLLRGMREDGVLTTVDPETEHQRLARQSLLEAGYGTGRVRLIAGRALEVLPRLSDSAYDLVFCDALAQENSDYLTAAVRLLRPGGLVVFAGALGAGRVADPSARDADTVALRELAKAVREHEQLTPALLPVGAGLLAAVLS
ncbi:MAG: O-methyltransferase family protein [Frankiales bacterium]|jgi:predicted O-methyltransferase YrrM|nr:O-methyltransferase family protein [Frankiales bacterium]